MSLECHAFFASLSLPPQALCLFSPVSSTETSQDLSAQPLQPLHPSVFFLHRPRQISQCHPMMPLNIPVTKSFLSLPCRRTAGPAILSTQLPQMLCLPCSSYCWSRKFGNLKSLSKSFAFRAVSQVDNLKSSSKCLVTRVPMQVWSQGITSKPAVRCQTSTVSLHQYYPAFPSLPCSLHLGPLSTHRDLLTVMLNSDYSSLF